VGRLGLGSGLGLGLLLVFTVNLWSDEPSDKWQSILIKYAYVSVILITSGWLIAVYQYCQVTKYYSKHLCHFCIAVPCKTTFYHTSAHWRSRVSTHHHHIVTYFVWCRTDARYWYSNSVCPSVTFRYSIEMTQHSVIVSSPYGSPIILVLWLSHTFAKFRRAHPLQGRWLQLGYKNSAIFDH